MICNSWSILSGEGEIRCEQLDMVAEWIGAFQDANKKPDEDVVFDVLCGDFNFDNCSPGMYLNCSNVFTPNFSEVLMPIFYLSR